MTFESFEEIVRKDIWDARDEVRLKRQVVSVMMCVCVCRSIHLSAFLSGLRLLTLALVPLASDINKLLVRKHKHLKERQEVWHPCEICSEAHVKMLWKSSI